VDVGHVARVGVQHYLLVCRIVGWARQVVVAMPFISGMPGFCATGESNKGHLALPFICGMLPLMGGQRDAPFFQALRDQPSRFSCRFAA
jgi:hypothetical protein